MTTTPTQPADGVVNCHYCPDTHPATYTYRNAYGQHLWSVVCGGYVDRYTAEAVRPVPEEVRS